MRFANKYIFPIACALAGVTSSNAATPTNGVDGYVDAVALQPNGAIVIAGEFTTVGGLPRSSVARLLADGRLDATFNPALSTSSRVDAMVVQPDGKVIVAGYFPDAQASGGFYALLRLKIDGSLDGIPAQPDGSPNALYVQTDGKILVGGGSFENVGGMPRLHLARLNADLTLDAVFQPSAPLDADIYTFDEQTDGSIIIAGRFETIADPVTEIPAASVARVDSSGNVDSSFAFPIEYHQSSAYAVHGARLLPSGKIVVGGYYYLAGVGPTTTSLHNSDGSLDTSDFTPATLGGPSTLTLQSDGKVLLGGVFSTIGNATDHLSRNNVGRLTTTGSPDNQFVAQTESGGSGQVIAFAEQTDGKILLGGSFTQIDGQARTGIARVLSTGALDAAFNVTDDIFSGTFDQ